MTSINTNLSSLIVQKNLTKSTNALNQAVERLTTGFKINHASDNAANYSISESMSSKLSSYMVAEDNTSMGLDLIRTQSSTLDTIQNLTTRLRALAEQAHNGTYGAQSLEAINQEAEAIISEIERIGNNAEYNGIKLFDDALSQAGIPQLKSNGLMQEVERRDTSGMTRLADVNTDDDLAVGTYSITTAEELAKLSEIVNNGDYVSNCEFVLGADIDLSVYSEGEGWTPIGDSIGFEGMFDGNGYQISNLKISLGNDSIHNHVGLFGLVRNAEIKNVILSNCDIKMSGGPAIGACLAANCNETSIENCSVSGNVINSTNGTTGLLVGIYYSVHDKKIENCYLSGTVVGNEIAGSVLGKGESMNNLLINNCVSNANVITEASIAGGIAGYGINMDITNCGVFGDVVSKSTSGGIVGRLSAQSANLVLENVLYSGSKLIGQDNKTGLFIGQLSNNGVVSNVRVSGMYDSCMSGTTVTLGKVTTPEKLILNSQDKSSQLQVGVDSTEASNIKFTTNMSLSSISSLRGGMEGANSLENIDLFISKLSEAQTKLGAVENRLTSAIESIGVNIENLTSSRSTLKDADVAKESSQLLKNQILQQAAATLLATANQTPAIALRLLGGM